MDTKNYFVHRRGNLHHERAVLVSQQENGWGEWIDPQELVLRATGLMLGRGYCIQSFVKGIRDVGHEVTLLRQWAHKTQGRTSADHLWGPIFLEYYIFGLAYGLGQLKVFTEQMQRIKYGHAHDILCDTARFYLDDPVYMCGWDRIELKL